MSRGAGESRTTRAETRCRCGHMALDHAADLDGNPIGWCYQCGCQGFAPQSPSAGDLQEGMSTVEAEEDILNHPFSIHVLGRAAASLAESGDPGPWTLGDLQAEARRLAEVRLEEGTS